MNVVNAQTSANGGVCAFFVFSVFLCSFRPTGTERVLLGTQNKEAN